MKPEPIHDLKDKTLIMTIEIDRGYLIRTWIAKLCFKIGCGILGVDGEIHVTWRQK